MVPGIQTGTLVWGAFTSLGVTALLTASHLAYTALRWIGAAYLIWMAARMLRDTFRGRPPADTDDASQASAPGAAADSFGGGWRQGALTNLLNPKMGASTSPCCRSSSHRARRTSPWASCSPRSTS